MLSKSIEKYVNSLKQKKYRLEYKRFIAEGEKISTELLHSSFTIEKIFALPQWISAHEKILSGKERTIEEVSDFEMEKISSLITPSEVLMVVEIPEYSLDEKAIASNLNLALSTIQDPGNMGAIIRIADWFGIPNIFCSEDSVDVYNPKVVQASMGSLTRVKVFETNLSTLFQNFSSVNVYATTLDGENIFTAKLEDRGFIIIGNEAHGISNELEKFIHKKITIPKFGKAESLNAAVAAGIICAIFRNR